MASGQDPSGGDTGGFITEVDIENELPESPAASEAPKAEAVLALPPVNVHRVEDADLPIEALEDDASKHCAPMPSSIPIEKVMSNIVQNLDFKNWSEHTRSMWFKDFKTPASKYIMNDSFWYCICWYFKPGQHPDVEKRLFDRISCNFVGLFGSLSRQRKDLFFKFYADAVAQAVLYAMFLAYPKSRVNFTEKFRKDLVIRISYWTTGICPEFVTTTHWKLNLGGGDVLQATAQQAHSAQGMLQRSEGGGALVSAASQPVLGALTADSLAGKPTSLAHRAPRPLRDLRYSPLVAHYLRAKKFTSVNLVQSTKIGVTTAEERAKLMDVKHAMLVQRATAAQQHCDNMLADYNKTVEQSKKEEIQRLAASTTAKKRLEIRRKEVLRSDPHEYANYLVSLNLLQQGLGQSA